MVQIHPGLLCMSTIFQYIISQELAGKRLDIFLVEQTGFSRSAVQSLIKNGQVHVNDVLPKKAGDILREGQVVVISEGETSEAPQGEKKERALPSVEIIAETDEYLVVNKPAGLLVHPTQAREEQTLISWLLATYPAIATVGDSPERPGIVHRLDKEASGVLVIAKTQAMFDALKKQFQEKTIEKHYRVLVHGSIAKDHDTITFPIDRGKEGRMVSRPRIEELTLKHVKRLQPGKEAMTEFYVEHRYVAMTLLSVRIHTGRTHQIRVHMYAYGNPVVGDTLYFQRKWQKKSTPPLDRLFLHAEKLCFTTLSGEKVCYEVPLPQQLNSFLEQIV